MSHALAKGIHAKMLSVKATLNPSFALNETLFIKIIIEVSPAFGLANRAIVYVPRNSVIARTSI
jgi:hypothetical protein